MSIYQKNLISEIEQELQSDLGILKSYRVGVLGKERVDNNLFFTLSAYVVLRDSGHDDLLKLLDQSIKSNLEQYKNKFDRCTYNFWPTNPYQQWPNSFFLSRIKHFWIPDDLDCTALSYFFHDSSDIEHLRQEVKYYTSRKLFPKSDKEYYTTWFGPKMPAELDLCVLSNYFLLLKVQNVELNELDLRTLEVFITSIRDKEYLTSPFSFSPNYQALEIICFHLARLICAAPEWFDEELRLNFKQQIMEQFETAETVQERVMYSLSLSYLGELQTCDIVDKEFGSFIKTFSFFKASMLFSSSSKRVKKMANKNWSNINFISPGFNKVLLLSLKIKE